ncbi:LINE-1 type transposase domain containing protein 1 [Dissostichus eleginoides]|uniref:LINE-1 type transposase domain containing protein 1 n=1 Tax=Dissostichus eleginoides TaxID=100907 RepID=A0AAD9FKR1_DISEL|nr:LINE-1 type transposase domain containing protein 1 [Dissostichus eleginoides]
MLIKQAIADEMETLQGTVADMLKGAIEKALNPLEKHLVENGNILRSLKEQADGHAKKFDTVFNKIDSIQVAVRRNEKETSLCIMEVTKMRRKLNELEDRSRMNNVRIVNLPTGVEGDDPRGYLQKMLHIWIPSIKSPNSNPLEIDRAHRIFYNNTSRLRTMVLKLLRYTDRQAILEGARKVRPTLQDGTQLLFFADYSPGTTQERQEYKEIRIKLRQKGIDSFIIYPSILRVNNKGTRMSFKSAEEAKEALKSTVLDMREDPGH